MKIAVTGANGFIGRPFIAEAVRQGHAVLALVRQPERQRGQFPPGVAVDFFDASAPVKHGLFDGVDAVVHLAGAPIAERWTRENKEKVMRSRVEGTRAVARAIAQAGSVKVFLSGSAIGFYGDRGAEILDESSGPGSGFQAEVCKAWEHAATSESLPHVRRVLLRTGIVLHPSAGALKKMLMPFKLGAGATLGAGTQYMSWIHLDDQIRLMHAALTDERLSGPLNLTAPNPVTNREFTRLLGRALHRPALARAPAFALKWVVGEMSSIILESQRVMPRQALDKAAFTFLHPRLEEAFADLFRKQAA